jgi:hypothetical protein
VVDALKENNLIVDTVLVSVVPSKEPTGWKKGILTVVDALKENNLIVDTVFVLLFHSRNPQGRRKASYGRWWTL